MQSERHNATSRNLRIATEDCTDLLANRRAVPDTRRFATIFSMEVPGAVSVDGSDTTSEEQNDSDDLSRSKFIAMLDENVSTTQVVSVPSVGESSTLSVAQRAIACYHTIHGNDHAPECDMTDKDLPQIPDDQRSMYTLATGDTQSTMDMMWKPKPKVHMHRADQLALMQAQGQAIAMMHNAGLTPTNKIQCRRRGCADILPNVEALKYHIHIHNIADLASQRNDTAPAACKTSVAGCSISKPKDLKRNHSRSKSSHETRHRYPTTYTFPRNLSASTLPPSLFSPRETTPEASQAPSFTTVAKAFTPDPSPNKPAVSLPVCNDEMLSAHVSAPSRGRRKRKKSTTVSVSTEYIPSIAMLLSPPSSPITHGRQLSVLGTHALSMDTESDNYTPISNESAQLVPEQVKRSRSPMRALSPSRAMSPIRNGIKRILAIGNATDQ